MKLVEGLERLAKTDAQKNHPLVAGRKYMRAGLYYLTAERMPSHKDPRRLLAYQRGVDARGLKLRREPVERVEVPHRSAPRLFRQGAGFGRCTPHGALDGFDATKETIYGAVGEEYAGASRCCWSIFRASGRHCVCAGSIPDTENGRPYQLSVPDLARRERPPFHSGPPKSSAPRRSTARPRAQGVFPCRRRPEHCGADNGSLVIDSIVD